jgi:hypothetical protein
MKNFVKIVLLLGAIMALGGIAAAADGDPVPVAVTASGDVSDQLTFNVDEAATGVDLGDIFEDSGVPHTGAATLTATFDWQVVVTPATLNLKDEYDPIGHPVEYHTLFAPLTKTITPATGVPGYYDAGTATGHYAKLVTSYSQVFTPGDYAGDNYQGTLTWTASASF